MLAKEGVSLTKGFRVPFGPYLVPGVSVAACQYLMYGLSMTTYRVFAIWMTVAVLMYFIYGIRNSRLNGALPKT
jgi:APA family basic amino acid/polyamine antiporter